MFHTESCWDGLSLKAASGTDLPYEGYVSNCILVILNAGTTQRQTILLIRNKSVKIMLTFTMCLWNDFVTDGRLFFFVKIAGPPSLDTS